MKTATSPSIDLGRLRLPAGPAVVALAALTLGAVYVSEHGFGLEPCALCLYQRWPWWAALGLGAGLIAARGRPALGRALLGLTGLALLTGAGIAAYHMGVEYGWWPGPAACAPPGAGGPMELDALRAQVMGRERIVPCDEAAIRVLGLSMAGWNVLISLAATIPILGAALRRA